MGVYYLLVPPENLFPVLRDWDAVYFPLNTVLQYMSRLKVDGV